MSALSAEEVAPRVVGGLAVRRFGAGRPLVLVHGGVGSWTHFIANLPPLAARFEITAVDLPGFGDAPDAVSRDPDAYLDAVAQGLAQAMDDTERFGLVGFSFGAVVSAAVARRLKARVTALSLLGPGGFGVPLGRTLPLVPVPSRTDDPAGHRAALAHNLGAFMLSAPPAPEDPVVDLQSANAARLRFDSRKISLQDRLVDDISAVPQPLQVIWGGEDRLPVPSIAARAAQVAAARPDAEIHILPDAGHWVQYEAPRAVEDLISDFQTRMFK